MITSPLYANFKNKKLYKKTKHVTVVGSQSNSKSGLVRRYMHRVCMVVHVCNPSTQRVEVVGQSVVASETLPPKDEKPKTHKTASGSLCLSGGEGSWSKFRSQYFLTLICVVISS